MAKTRNKLTGRNGGKMKENRRDEARLTMALKRLAKNPDAPKRIRRQALGDLQTKGKMSKPNRALRSAVGGL